MAVNLLFPHCLPTTTGDDSLLPPLATLLLHPQRNYSTTATAASRPPSPNTHLSHFCRSLGCQLCCCCCLLLLKLLSSHGYSEWCCLARLQGSCDKHPYIFLPAQVLEGNDPAEYLEIICDLLALLPAGLNRLLWMKRVRRVETMSRTTGVVEGKYMRCLQRKGVGATQQKVAAGVG